MGRARSLRKQCAEPGCGEYGHYTDLTRESYMRLEREVWRCVRHTRPDEVLSETNLRREVILENNQLPHGRYWGASRGFIYGPGFKAYANDFPAGTKIKVTAEIVYPTQETRARNIEHTAAHDCACDECVKAETPSALPFTHWSKDPLIPYANCKCSTCEDARRGVIHPEWTASTPANRGAGDV